jgi:hypothetical protein
MYICLRVVNGVLSWHPQGFQEAGLEGNEVTLLLTVTVMPSPDVCLLSALHSAALLVPWHPLAQPSG